MQNSTQSSSGGVPVLPRPDGGMQNQTTGGNVSAIRKTTGSERLVKKEKKSIFKKPDQMPGRRLSHPSLTTWGDGLVGCCLSVNTLMRSGILLDGLNRDCVCVCVCVCV